MKATYTHGVIIYKKINYIFLLNIYKLSRKMSCSKYQLSARMKRTNLDLNEKMKVLKYASEHSKL